MEPANDEWLAHRAAATARALDLRWPAPSSDASARMRALSASPAELTRGVTRGARG